jgi:hypothetical protein
MDHIELYVNVHLTTNRVYTYCLGSMEHVHLALSETNHQRQRLHFVKDSAYSWMYNKSMLVSTIEILEFRRLVSTL